jgi:inorganic triphosphatase YgiF
MGVVVVVAGEWARGPREIELKLEFDPADAARIASHPALEASLTPPEEQELVSLYYDTDDLALRKAGVFLRVRDCGGRFVQTIKAADSEAELFERFEWEQELLSREPNLDAASGTALAALLTPKVRASLRPRFETRIRRKIYRPVRDGIEIEVAIDQGEIVGGARSVPISELELELKAGQTAELFRLATILAASAPLRLAVKTKAERGFELLEEADHAMEKAVPVHITGEMASADAFRAIARSCLRQIIANEPGMCAGRAEALHQMRIGLRRFRAAISLFSEMVSDQDLPRIKAELQWITKELGPARDLDVFAAEVLAPMKAAHPEDGEVAAAHRALEERRKQAYDRARGSVRSDRFRHALLDLAEWAEIGPWASEEDAKRDAMRARPIAEHAEKKLRRLRKRIKKRGAHLRELSVRKRHRLRISAKRLRYGTEFFASTFPGEKQAERRERSLAALRDLQDALGGLNDLAMRPALLADGGEGQEVSHGLGAVETDGEKLLSAAEEAFARFAEVKPFWKG